MLFLAQQDCLYEILYGGAPVIRHLKTSLLLEKFEVTHLFYHNK